MSLILVHDAYYGLRRFILTNVSIKVSRAGTCRIWNNQGWHPNTFWWPFSLQPVPNYGGKKIMTQSMRGTRRRSRTLEVICIDRVATGLILMWLTELLKGNESRPLLLTNLYPSIFKCHISIIFIYYLNTKIINSSIGILGPCSYLFPCTYPFIYQSSNLNLNPQCSSLN